jgi:hypothetical protein
MRGSAGKRLASNWSLSEAVEVTEPASTAINTDDLDLRLGSMVRAAASTDFLLVIIAQQLCGGSYGALLVAGESTERVINVCKTLIDAHDDISEPRRTELRELLRQCRDLFQKRHRYVHGTAITGMDGGMVSIRTRRLAAKMETTPIKLEELQKLRQDFDVMGNALMDWIAEVFAGIYPETA